MTNPLHLLPELVRQKLRESINYQPDNISESWAVVNFETKEVFEDPDYGFHDLYAEREARDECYTANVNAGDGSQSMFVPRIMEEHEVELAMIRNQGFDLYQLLKEIEDVKQRAGAETT